MSVVESIASMTEAIESKSIEAEENNDMTLLSQANAFLKSVKKKEQVLLKVDNNFTKLQKELDSL